MSHPVEALLRPPVELWTAACCGCAAVLAALGPELWMLAPSVAMTMSVLLGLLAAFWAHLGARVLRYQWRLRSLPRWSLAAEQIPVSETSLFLGRGFAWSERHTQRLHDTRRTRFRRFVEAGRLERLIRAAHRRLVSRAQPDTAPDPGGLSTLHGVEPVEQPVSMPLADRNGHTLVLGTTRVGKTRALELAVEQDIRRGETVIVIDPKGDADLLRWVVDACERAGRRDALTLFHLGYPDLSARYNAVGEFHRITEIATRIANQLSDDGQSAVFREFAWRFTNIVAKAIVALGARPDYRTILRNVTNLDALFVDYARAQLADEPDAQAAVDRLTREVNPQRQPRHLLARSPELIAFEQYFVANGCDDEVLNGLRSAFKYERAYFDKIVASLLPLLEKLTTGRVSELLSPDYLDPGDVRPIFDWRQVINQRRVVYVGLDALSDTAVASAVGNAMFADLVSLAGARYKFGDGAGLRPGAIAEERPIVVHLDEFAELMGDEFIPMINKGGAAGLQITAYSQTFSDIEARTGNRAKARQVSGNFNTLIVFRVRDVETAALLTDQLPSVRVHELTLIAGYQDSSDPDSSVDFTSRHEDRLTSSTVTLLEPHDVMKLPKGQAFALLEGGRLVKLRLPLPKRSHPSSFAASFEAITAEMQQRYSSRHRWWQDADTIDDEDDAQCAA